MIKSIDIIIPLFNAKNEFETCVESLHKTFAFFRDSRPDIFINLKVYDDQSSQETLSFVKANKKKFTYDLHLNKENLGFLKNCNQAISQSTSEIIVLLNSDTVVPENFIQPIIDCFESDDTIAIASPISSNSENNFIQIPRGKSFDEVATKVSQLSNKNYPDIMPPEGFCLCLRKKHIEKIGLYDEVFGQGYYEEVDLGMRALENNFKVVCIDNLFVFHKNNASFGATKRRELKLRNRNIFMKRWCKKYLQDFDRKMNPSPISYLKNEIEVAGGVTLKLPDFKDFFIKVLSMSWHEKYVRISIFLKNLIS